MPCGKPMVVVVPKGRYDYKEITVKCGNTMTDGYPYLCDACAVRERDTNWRQLAAEAGEVWDEDK